MAQPQDVCWSFHCPECGFGDSELGHLLAAHEVHCIICLEAEGRHVRLRRWLTVEDVDLKSAA